MAKRGPNKDDDDAVSKAVHENAFDRLFLCDYMFLMVDKFLDSTKKNRDTKLLIKDGKVISQGIIGSDGDHQLYMSKRVAVLFKKLNVTISFTSTQNVIVRLNEIFADDKSGDIKAGYIYSILQGLKMGVIANATRKIEIWTYYFNRLVTKQVSKCVTIGVLSPYFDTTYNYLRAYEHYPPLDYLKSGKEKDCAPSFEMNLMDSSHVPWYWNANLDVVYDSDVSRKIIEGNFEKLGISSEEMSRVVEMYERVDDIFKNDHRNEHSKELSDIHLKLEPLEESARQCLVQFMKSHNEKLAKDSSSTLVPRDERKIIFCSESLLGIRIFKEVGTHIWSCFMKPRLDELSKLSENEEIAGKSAMAYAVFSDVLCKSYYSEIDQPSHLPPKARVVDFTARMKKRKPFGHMSFGNPVMDVLLGFIANDVMERGDIFVRRITLLEYEEDQEPTNALSTVYDTMVHGYKDGYSGLQKASGSKKAKGGVMMSCMTCKQRFSFLESLRMKCSEFY